MGGLVSERHNRAAALAAWGDDAPDWIVVLADECDRASMRAVAMRIGYGPSVVTESLRRKYAGRLDRVEAAVRGAFMGATVDCPVLGELPRDRCLVIQKRPFGSTNPHRVMLAKACPACPHCRGRPVTTEPGETPR